MSTAQIREAFINFYRDKHHQIIPSASLVPENDPTTLFTGSGMQPLVPYLLGEPHPLGKRLANSQRCFRAQDIEEVGDNRHTTFFEMLGNWSLGDYFKKEQLNWFFIFLTEVLELDPQKLYVTVFRGGEGISKDVESIKIWQEIFARKGIKAKEGERIFAYDFEKNWWSRTGPPDTMPVGEPGGPDSEVFYDFGIPHDDKYGKQCHPNCDCGRFLEIGNSVFMQYVKTKDGSLAELDKKNVDFGGGLERLAAAKQNQPDIFRIDMFWPIIKQIEKITNKSYEEEKNKSAMRIIADHLRASTFLIADGVRPSNKDRGYILRRLLRRTAIKMYGLREKVISAREICDICHLVIKTYQNSPYFEQEEETKHLIDEVIKEEIELFGNTVEKGLRQVDKIPTKKMDTKFAFDLYQSYGLPFELIQEIFAEKGIKLDRQLFQKEMEKHRRISRRGLKRKFAGGLADHSKETIKLHTATHLLHQALRDILGNHVKQKGSHITAERLRFDFSHPRKLTKEELEKIEEKVNKKIRENLPVRSEIMKYTEAIKQGALGFFHQKYGEKVKVYSIGNYSKEICGGPHVNSTKVLGRFKIKKETAAAKNTRRIYAVLINE